MHALLHLLYYVKVLYTLCSQYVSENVYKPVHKKEQQNLMSFLRASDGDSTWLHYGGKAVLVQAEASLNIQDRAGLRTA